MRWCWRALSAASVASVLLVALAMLLFTPGQAIAGQSRTVWHPQPNDPSALSRIYDVNRSAMQTAGAPFAKWAAQGRQFLAFDPSGDGRVVEVFGDLGTADRIAVLVPGVSTTANNFSSGLDNVRVRAPAVQARDLYDATRAAAPGQRVAVIAWLGYDAPQGIGRDAAREELARAGAASLDRFTQDLTIMRPNATLTLVGHSYGSVVTGLAAASLPKQVKDLVVVGSPGMGVSRAADLHTTARVWAGQAAQDWIDWVPAFQVWGAGHGTLPATPDFGARVFGTSGVVDHDHYLAPGTASLANIVSVVLGRDSAVTGPNSLTLPPQASG